MVWVCHILFIRSSVGGHLGCFHLLGIASSAAVNLSVRGCFEHLFLFYFFNKLIYVFIYIILAVLGLYCCAQDFSSCGERGLLFVAVRRLLTAVASLVAEHGL